MKQNDDAVAGDVAIRFDVEGAGRMRLRERRE